MKSVLHRALARSPDDRFASASLMADALREAMGETAPPSALAAAVAQTVVAVSARRAVPQPSAGTGFDQALLSQIERRLAHRLGPIARYLVQSAIRNAASVEELCNVLAQRIDHPDDRKLFLWRHRRRFAVAPQASPSPIRFSPCLRSRLRPS